MYMLHVHVRPVLTSWNEECVSLTDSTDVALRDEVTEKHFTLIGRHHPLLVANQILLCGRYEVEYLLPSDHMVPDGCATKVNVEVRVAVLDSHKTVFLNKGTAEKTGGEGERERYICMELDSYNFTLLSLGVP